MKKSLKPLCLLLCCAMLTSLLPVFAAEIDRGTVYVTDRPFQQRAGIVFNADNSLMTGRIDAAYAEEQKVTLEQGDPVPEELSLTSYRTILDKYDLSAAVHTVNSSSGANTLFDPGADVIYTDFLIPYEQ